MNGPHDLGGQMGHGPVIPEKDEPLFHAEWEKKAMAITLAIGATGSWTIDRSRHTRESLPAVTYLSASYYEIWLRALVELMRSHDMISDDELNHGRSLEPGRSVKRILKAADVPAVLAKGTPYDRPSDMPPLFKAGDRIRCSNDQVMTHTRMPSYIRNAVGEIVENHGAFIYPDSNAHGGGESPKWCYAVRFKAQELWGKGADANSEVMVDLFEPYLQRLTGLQ
jgi:nitrile hydratase subunit beta